MRICILGNSHIAALKVAWDRMKTSFEGVEIDFFGSRARTMKDLEVRDGILEPQSDFLKRSIEVTSGGQTCIDPESFDLFLVYGLGAGALFVSPNAFYSSAVLAQAAKDFVHRRGISFRTISLLRQVTQKRIFVGHDPLPALEAKSDNRPPGSYSFGVGLLNRLVYEPINAELLEQPSNTILNERSTRPEFSLGSVRLSIGVKNDGDYHPRGEYTHMNDQFGEIWLTDFLTKALHS